MSQHVLESTAAPRRCSGIPASINGSGVVPFPAAFKNQTASLASGSGGVAPGPAVFWEKRASGAVLLAIKEASKVGSLLAAAACSRWCESASQQGGRGGEGNVGTAWWRRADPVSGANGARLSLTLTSNSTWAAN